MSKVFKTTVLISVNDEATADDVRHFIDQALVVDVDTEIYGSDVGFECLEILTDHLEVAVVADMYENQECPDCGRKIPLDAEEGEACFNCGHVFCFPRNND
jgi:hypothetical protein